MPHLSQPSSRRAFLKGLTVTTASGIILPNLLLRAQETPASKRLGIACIGVGGKGASDLDNASFENEIVAICDVDANNLAKAAAKYPNAKLYRDFRKMLDEVKNIDAVTVSVPDHAHFPAAMHAMALGKHVMVQKPLGNTLWEVDQLHKASKKKGVITQMGNQGHTFEENRLLKEWFQAGVIGKVKEIHVWTNRPIWPQGSAVATKSADIPKELDWQLWLAATPDVPYAPGIAPFAWRGRFAYGSGALGDMGCHNLDPLVWGLGLGVPNKIEAIADGLTDNAWPRGAKVQYFWKDIPGHGDIKLYWYEGKNTDGSACMPPPPKELGNQKLSETGFYIIGADGVLYNQGDQAKNLTILPEARSQQFLANPPAKTLERSPTPGDPQREWSLAIKQGKPFATMGQFDYSVPLTELCLLGDLAIRTGKPIEWDQQKFEATGNPEANKLIKRTEYRPGWDYSANKI
jgi:predicted dehydrogenase